MRIKQNPEIMTELDIDIYAGISTVCPRSRLPIFYSNLKYKLGNYFLDRRYINRQKHEPTQRDEKTKIYM